MSKKPAPPEAEQPSSAAPAEPDAAVAELREQLAQELPPPPPRPAMLPAPDADPDAAINEVESTLEEFAERPEKMGELSATEWADFWQDIVFGLTADGRGSHWEIDNKRAARLGAYTKKVLDRYEVGTESFAKHIPALALALLLTATIYRRWKEDQRLRHPTPVIELHTKEEIQT